MQQVGAIYAKALLGAAEKEGRIDAVLEEFDSFLTYVLDIYPDLEAILSSNVLSAEIRIGILDRLFQSQASAHFMNFLKVLSERGRFDCLRAIRQICQQLYDEMRGRVQVRVTTATPLVDGSNGRLLDTLAGFLGGEPRVVQSIDPELIGGILIRVGDTVYDASVATQLKHIRGRMIDRSVHEIQSRRDRFRNPSGN